MKNKISKPMKAIAFGLAAMMLCSCAGGAGKAGEVQKTDIDLSSYPINTDKTLTWWTELPSSATAVCNNLGETQFAEGLKERTGVNVEFLHPALGQASEAFGLMIASDEMADMIRYNWSTALGGPSTTLEDGIIIPLNGYIEEYAPALKKFLADRPEVDKEVKTDDGEYYVFPFIRNDKSLLVSQGFIIRTDWLKDCGLEMPTTTEEIENALIQFRDKKGAKSPLCLTSSYTNKMFTLFGATNDLYVEDGKIKHGMLEPEFKEALAGLNKWYSEGLIDRNFISADQTYVNSNVLNNQTGIAYGSGGQNLGQWLSSAASTGSSLDMTGMPWRVEEKGGLPKFTSSSATYAPHGSVAISTSCKEPALAAKFLDYGYTEEGEMYYNFGTEGVSYNMIDGYPTYTDDIMKNPDGLAVNQAMSKYILGHAAGPFLQNKGYIEQYYSRKQQQEALKNWTIGVEETTTALPSLLYTPDEASERSSIINELGKYTGEKVNSFISGNISLDTYDEFIDTIKAYKIERLIEITQAAYDRYMSR